MANKILQQTREIYNQIAPDFSDTRGHWWKGMGSFNKYVAPGDQVLDLGCGNGRMAEIFLASKINYLGLDNSDELIKIARQRFRDKSWIKFELDDITNLKLPDNQYNLVLLIAVLHHIPTQKLRLKILSDIHKTLKPGGHLVMSNWNLWQVWGSFDYKLRYWKYLFNYSEKIKNSAWNVSDAFVPWKANRPRGQWAMRYVHSFGKREVVRLLRRAGFIVEKINYESRDRQATILSGDHLLAIAVKK
ncbi:MAG: class I SAM-dependent methyltransferase [Patescibacteria group bacterium]